MASWREKLANKTTTVVTKEESPSIQQTSTGNGWKQRLSEKTTSDQPQKPVIPKISIDDLNQFPALGGSSSAVKKEPVLKGFATLAKEWSEHAKEEKEREEKEQRYREQQENAYNYNMSKLNAINNRLMQFNYNQVKYDDEYNADYNNDLDNHNDDY
jgi:hypothetical protein